MKEIQQTHLEGIVQSEESLRTPSEQRVKSESLSASGGGRLAC